MDTVLQLLTNFGLPTTLLLLVGWYHVRTVGKKDAEIKRLNDERIKEKDGETGRALSMQADFMQLQGEQQQTLSLIADRLPRRR
jgi:hypothetical protein